MTLTPEQWQKWLENETGPSNYLFSAEQKQKIVTWLSSQKIIPQRSCEFNVFPIEFRFRTTNVGMIVTIYNHDTQETLDVTDYDSF